MSKLSSGEYAKELITSKHRLKQKLQDIDLNQADISDYNTRYLKNKIKKIDGTLDLYANLLRISIQDTGLSKKEIVFVDYGGGSGLLSLLAKEMGVGTVIYVDIFRQSCIDVKTLSAMLDLSIDHVIHGDVDDLLFFLREESIAIHAIASFDVIEHIYDIEDHFRKINTICSNFRLVYASGANIKNPYVVRHLKKQQRQAEFCDREEDWGHKKRDSLKAYYKSRKEIIHMYSPELSQKTVDFIASATRGLREEDILKCVAEFKKTGQITYSINHPTNTCDPFTGNWCEHLIDMKWLTQTIQNSGFAVTILNGKWFATSSTTKRIISNVLNFFITISGTYGLIIAPYYIVVADHNITKGC